MRVLVTRPWPGAGETAARLVALGLQPLILPLTETVAVAPTADAADAADAVGADAVAVTSASAVRHAPEALLAGLAGLPVFAVGARTGLSARAAGLRVVDEGAGDAEGLARRIGAAFAASARIAILCGRVRRDVLETRLVAGGHRPRIIETYDTLMLDPADAAVAAVLGDGRVDAALLHSASGAAVLCRLAGRPAVADKLGEAAFFCLSARIADALRPIAPKRVLTAAEPTEESLLGLLAAGR